MKHVLTTQDLSLAHGLRVALEAEGIAVVPNADASSIASHAPTTVTVLRDEDHFRFFAMFSPHCPSRSSRLACASSGLRFYWLSCLSCSLPSMGSYKCLST